MKRRPDDNDRLREKGPLGLDPEDGLDRDPADDAGDGQTARADSTDDAKLRSSMSFMSSRNEHRPAISEEAYHGLAGDFVRAVEPHSEADPVALLVQFLAAIGNIIGRAAHFVADGHEHFLNLFIVLVGDTSKARKGTALGRVRSTAKDVDPTWNSERVVSGLSSGEGLIWAVRDPIVKTERIDGEYEEVIADEGVTDKRLLVVEEEFASVLKAAGRQGSTLSPLVRRAWDSGNLQSLTKNSPAQATDAHISIIGHVTTHEIRRELSTTEAANGFANRFIWLFVQRSKCLPEGGTPHLATMDRLGERLRGVVAFARDVRELRRDPVAKAAWAAVYPSLSEGKPGLLGAVIARGEVHVMRLACIYALLDESDEIGIEHLLAAIAVWEFAEESAQYAFGDALGDPLADEILVALRRSAQGLTRTQIRDLLGRNQRGDQIASALAVLLREGSARMVQEVTGGRPAERWFAVSNRTTKTTETTKGYPPGSRRSYMQIAKAAADAARSRSGCDETADEALEHGMAI